MINIRTKGASGELEICRILEPIVRGVLAECGKELPVQAIIQRNQNQSAVGGSDLTNTFGLCIEVKRQEQLAINDWWKQCVEAAVRNNEIPVLLYRQNQRKWQAVMLTDLFYGETGDRIKVRATIAIEDFLDFFRRHVMQCMIDGTYNLRI